MEQNKYSNLRNNILIVISCSLLLSHNTSLSNETRLIIIVFINTINIIFIRGDFIKKTSEIIAHVEVLNKEVNSLRQELKKSKITHIRLNSEN